MRQPCLIRASISHVERTVLSVVTAFDDVGIVASVEDTLPLNGSVAVTMRRPLDGQRVQILGKVVRVTSEGIWKDKPAVEITFGEPLSAAQMSDTGQFEATPPMASEPLAPPPPPAEDGPGFGSATMAFFDGDLSVTGVEGAPRAMQGFGTETMAFFSDGGASEPAPLVSDDGRDGVTRDRTGNISAPVFDGTEALQLGDALELPSTPSPVQAPQVSAAAGFFPVRVEFRLAGRKQHGEVTEMDAYGMYVESEATVRRGAILEVDVPVQDGDHRDTHRCTASVRWLSDDKGMPPPKGFYVEIDSFKNAKGRKAYDDFVKRLQG